MNWGVKYKSDDNPFAQFVTEKDANTFRAAIVADEGADIFEVYHL